MTLVRYNPLHDFVPGNFGDLIESALRTAESDVTYKPAVDILRDDKQIEIQLAAPGMKKEDFKIDLHKSRLEISGERKLDASLKDKFQKRESGYGKFSRVFSLSDEIDQEKISATYKEGILTIQLPLMEKKEKTIEVK